ncbi:MAG TPA: CPBP family intramembrane glutamic endopeptidase [Candidatus Angelobacter sp.]
MRIHSLNLVHSLDPISQAEPVPPIEVELLPLPEPAKTEVDLLDVLLVSVAMAVAFILLGSVAAVIFMFAHRSSGLNPKALEEALTKNAFFIVPTQFVIYVAIVGFMALLIWVRHRTSLAQAVHWNLPVRGRILANALMGGAALALISDIGEVVLHRWIPDSLPIMEYFKDRPSALLLGAFGILVAPLMEELLFRGFLYPALARWMGAAASVIITASAFTLLHGAQLGYSWAPLLLIFVVGLALTVTRMRTNSVATCVIVHMTYNFVLLLQSYIVTHGFRQMQGT